MKKKFPFSSHFPYGNIYKLGISLLVPRDLVIFFWVLKTQNNNPLSLSFIEHPSSSLTNISHQSVTYSNFPNNITLIVSPNGVDYSASSNIESISYSGQDLNLRQAAVISDFPDSFSSTFGDSFSWSSEKSIGSIQSQLSDSENPVSMSGNHFLFHQDK